MRLGVPARTELLDCRTELVLYEALEVIRGLVADGIEALAVCLLHSFRNPAHELLIKKLVADILAAGVEASVPSTMDSTVEATPMIMLFFSDIIQRGELMKSSYQRRERPGSG